MKVWEPKFTITKVSTSSQQPCYHQTFCSRFLFQVSVDNKKMREQNVFKSSLKSTPGSHKEFSHENKITCNSNRLWTETLNSVDNSCSVLDGVTDTSADTIIIFYNVVQHVAHLLNSRSNNWCWNREINSINFQCRTKRNSFRLHFLLSKVFITFCFTLLKFIITVSLIIHLKN